MSPIFQALPKKGAAGNAVKCAFFSLFVGASLTLGCGTNTDEPVFPLYTITAVGAPTITQVKAQEVITYDLESKIEFDVNYFITNSEDGFLGYNLYMSTSATSAESGVGGGIIASGGPYLPNGHAPSFQHVDATPDTSNTKIIIQRITHFKAPPAESTFERCEKYYFRLTAVTRTGAESLPSPELSACASVGKGLCPLDGVCAGQ